MKMNVKYTLYNIIKFQNSSSTHKLTCGFDSSHRILRYELLASTREPVLVCPDCSYTQKVPEFLVEKN